MFLDLLWDALLLFALGFCGWLLFKILRLPVAALLGTIFVIGALRAFQVELPPSPPLLSPFIQVFLGIYVGTRVTKETVQELKGLFLPALIIVFWALSVVFSLGYVLSHFAAIDLNTGILSSSIGGLPEMTVIALETDADIAVVIVMQSFRMVATVIVFPFMLRYWVKTENHSERTGPVMSVAGKPGGEGNARLPGPNGKRRPVRELVAAARDRLLAGFQAEQNPGRAWQAGMEKLAWSAATLALAVGGAWLFLAAGVPAGAMVGSMVFVAFASVWGVKVKAPSHGLFGLMLVGVGIMVSDNISPETLQLLLSGALIIPLLFSTALIFCSSFLVAYILSRALKWDFLTSFLAAAPGGFTVMTALAVSSGRNPFHVSMLHLCRLLVLKTAVPLAFMFFL